MPVIMCSVNTLPQKHFHIMMLLACHGGCRIKLELGLWGIFAAGAWNIRQNPQECFSESLSIITVSSALKRHVNIST